MTKDIVQTWQFPYPPELVWNYLTQPELLEQWLMKNDFKPVVGHRFNFHTKPLPKFGFDGIVHCEVLEVNPYRTLSYTWKGGANGKTQLDTIVVWTLVPKNGGTELTLEHKGFKFMKNFIAYFAMKGGWSTKIKKKIAERIEARAHESK